MSSVASSTNEYSSLTTPLNIQADLASNVPVQPGLHHQQFQGQPPPQQQFQQQQLSAAPWSISESENHCIHVFDKLRVQREQSRFADLILSVRGREFAAHRCVMAACSPWFDARLKVHKSTREHMAIDQCKDYEIFYALLTYIYTGNINIDGHNVAELLSLSVLFQMNKLKSYCCEYLSRNLHAKTVLHTAVDLAIRHNLIDLIRRCFGYLHSSFRYLFGYERQELMQYSPQVVQAFLSDKGFFLPPMLVLSFSTAWVNYDLSSREEWFGSLVYHIDWSKINQSSGGNGSLLPLLIEHLNEDQLYQNSPESLFNILRILDSKHIYLGRGFQEKYQRLQDQMLLEQDLDELNDSNSFLSMAINSAVKDLEHSEVDTNFFLENDPFRPPAPAAPEQHQQSMGPPSQALMQPQVSSQQQPLVSVQAVPPSSSSIMQQPIQSHHQYSYSNSTSTIASTSSSSNSSNAVKPESKLTEKFKDSFEFEIVEQLINEQQQSEQEKSKYTSTVKRYDPKYRALNEAFRQMEDIPPPPPPPPPPPSSSPPPPPTSSRLSIIQQSKYPLPKQRHLSSSEPSQSIHQSRQAMHNLPQRVAYDVSLNPLKVMALNPLERGGAPAAHHAEEHQAVWHSATSSASAPVELDQVPSKSIQEEETDQLENSATDALQSTSPPASPFTHLPASPGTPPPPPPPPATTKALSSSTVSQSSSTVSNIASDSALADSAAAAITAKEFPVQKKLASKERRAKAVAMMEENANATLDPKPAGNLELSLVQKQHVRKAKLLAEHRETLQRNGKQASEPSLVGGGGGGDSIGAVKLEIKKEDNVLITSQEATIQSNDNNVNEKLHHASKTSTRSREKKKGNLHRCPICGHSSKTKMSLYKHLSDAHMLQPPFRCMQTGCSFETSKLQILLNHDNVHSKETLFHCPAEGCDFAATTMHRMKFHKILHSDKVFHCHKCDKKFNHKSSLNTHLLVHETDLSKRLNCPSCSFSTKYKNHLSTHMRIHTGDVLKCSICTYTTPKKSLMTAHVRAHKKERPFKCDLCSKAFVENSALTRHKRIHSDELPFACTICTFKTRRRDKLKHHLLKKHPNNTEGHHKDNLAVLCVETRNE